MAVEWAPTQKGGDPVPVHRDDNQSIPKPMKRKDLLEILAELQPLAEEDQFPEIEDKLLPHAVLPADTNR